VFCACGVLRRSEVEKRGEKRDQGKRKGKEDSHLLFKAEKKGVRRS